MMRALKSALLLFLASLAASGAAAAADSASAPARLSQSDVAVGAPVLAKVNLHAKFSSVDSVCFDFTFTGDLLDPGEIVLVTPLQVFRSLAGPAVENVGLTSEGERTLCMESALGPDDAAVAALFADGKDSDLEIGTQNGSVQIASLVVTVTGTLR